MRFLLDESGAVTVDWVVLSAAVVGLGLATAGVVSGGIESSATDTSDVMTDYRIKTSFEQGLQQNDFENGPGDWVGGVVRDIPGFGNMLTLDGSNPTAALDLEVSDEYDYAIVEFDMVLADSWDNESATISFNDEKFLVSEMSWGSSSDGATITAQGETVTTTWTHTGGSTGTGIWGSRNNVDNTYRVRAIVANDGTPFEIGAATTLDQGYRDESFSLDNVSVSGSDYNR